MSEQTCANSNNTSTVTTNLVGLQRELNVDLDEHVFAICFGTVRGPIIKQQCQAPRSCHRQPRCPWSTSPRAQSTAVKKSGIPNTIPATASSFLGKPASNARFWGRRPLDFELDVETQDAEQKNTETGSQNQGTSEKRQENQTGAARRNRAEAGHKFPRLHFFGEGPVLGSAPFLCGSVLGSAPFASCVLKRQRSISSFALRTPTRRFVSRALEADTMLSAPFGERDRRELSEHPHP